jgi:hypothetical protein
MLYNVIFNVIKKCFDKPSQNEYKVIYLLTRKIFNRFLFLYWMNAFIFQYFTLLFIHTNEHWFYITYHCITENYIIHGMDSILYSILLIETVNLCNINHLQFAFHIITVLQTIHGKFFLICTILALWRTKWLTFLHYSSSLGYILHYCSI